MAQKRIAYKMIRTTVYITAEQAKFMNDHPELTYSGLMRKIIDIYKAGNQNILDSLY